MRCWYDYCDNLGVTTEETIRVNGKNYCKSCNDKREQKVIVRKKITDMLPREPMQKINKVINDLIEVKKYEWDYIVFALEYIVKSEKTLNYAMGIQYYLNNRDLLKSFEDSKTEKKYNKITKNKFECSEEETTFVYKSTKPTWQKLI